MDKDHKFKDKIFEEFNLSAKDKTKLEYIYAVSKYTYGELYLMYNNQKLVRDEYNKIANNANKVIFTKNAIRHILQLKELIPGASEYFNDLDM